MGSDISRFHSTNEIWPEVNKTGKLENSFWCTCRKPVPGRSEDRTKAMLGDKKTEPDVCNMALFL